VIDSVLIVRSDYVQAVELERDTLSQEVDLLRDTIHQLEREIQLHDKDRKYEFFRMKIILAANF